MSAAEREHETPGSLLVGGLMVIYFGTGAVLAAIGQGWLVAALLGAALLVLARRARSRASSAVVAYLLGMLGIAAVVGAAFDLLT